MSRRSTSVPPVPALIAILAIVAPLVLFGGRGGRTPTADMLDGAGAGSAPAPIGDGPRLPAPRKGRGALALAGVVVDGLGQPVPDVAISATLELGPGDRGTAPKTPPGPVIATAGADGRFVLDGMEPGRHRLDVDGAEIFSAEVRFVPVPSDEVRIVVARRVDIVGRVVDGAIPVAGATVEIAGDAIGGRLTRTTDAGGQFGFEMLPEGNYRIWAWRGDLASRAQDVPRLGSGPFAGVSIAIEPAAIVVGKVVERGAVPERGVAAAIALRPAGEGSEPARYARSAADGVFRIEGVPHGRWVADAWSPGWVTVSTVELDAGRGVPQIELALGGAIEGRVVDDRGAPIAGAMVRAGTTVSEHGFAERLRRYTGTAPAAAIATVDTTLADPQFAPRGELGVMTGPIPYPPPLGAGGVRHSAIVASAIQAIAGIGPGDPSPIAALDPSHEPRWTTDGDGRFRVVGLAAGKHALFARAAGLAEAATAPLTIALGETLRDVTIVMSPGTYLTGRVTDQRGDVVIGATIAGSPRGVDDPARRLDTVTGADGTYRLGPMTGEIDVVVGAYAHGDARLEVALPRPPPGAGAPIEERRDVVLAVADAVLAGTVDDPTGLPVRGATVTIVGGPGAGRSAVTGDAGFEIASLPHGELAVRIDHPQYPRHETRITTEAIAHLTLPYGGGVAGIVIDRHTSAAIAGIVIAASGPGSSIDDATDPGGAFELAPLRAGSWKLAVAHPGYVPRSITVDVPVGDRAGAVTVRDLRIELERGALVAGTLRDRYGTRIAGARVVARRAKGDGPAVEARSDADGVFRLRDVPTGAIAVRADHGDLRGTAALVVDPGDEVLSLEIELR